jgi:membrane-bound metal-dependent hydrolase YbcI (DUF457 family)
MDPLTHIVIGRAVVAAARDERRNHIVGAAAILGALAPDADSASAFWGWDRYIRAHQFGTHSILGAMAMAALAAIVVDRSAKAFARRRHARTPSGDAVATQPTEGSAKASAERFRTIFAAALAGALSHIALDLLSGARIAILWPFADRRVSLPFVAMFDPWLIAICIVWLLLLWPARVHLRRASRVAVAAAAIFLCAKALLLGLAVERSDFTPAEPSAIEARWGSLTTWLVFERAHDAVRTTAIASSGGPPRFVMTRPLVAETPLVHASRSLDDVRNFLAVHEFAFAAETSDGDGRRSVMWSDLRYCSPGGCGVWVGGTFDANGQPLIEEVRVGTVVQRRRKN